MTRDASRRYDELMDQVAAALGRDRMLELDALVGERLVEAEDTGCTERFRNLERQVEVLDLEVAHISIILGMMGHLATEARPAPAAGHRRPSP